MSGRDVEREAREADEPLVARLAELGEIEPSRASAERIRRRAMRDWDGRGSAGPSWPARSFAAALRLAPAAAAAVVLFLGSAQVLGATAESPLYPARVAVEDAAATLLSETDRAARLADLIRERHAEHARLTERGSPAADVPARARDAALRAYSDLVRPDAPREATPAPAPTPPRPDVTTTPAAPHASETLFEGRVLRQDGTPAGGICVTFGTDRCVATTREDGRFTATARTVTGAEMPLLLYAPNGELVASHRFTATGRAVQVFGDITLGVRDAAPASPAPTSDATHAPASSATPTPVRATHTPTPEPTRASLTPVPSRTDTR